MPKIDTTFRRAITAAVAEAGSINRLCIAARVPTSSVSSWLAGRQADLSWSVVHRLCDHLGLTLR